MASISGIQAVIDVIHGSSAAAARMAEPSLQKLLGVFPTLKISWTPEGSMLPYFKKPG